MAEIKLDAQQYVVLLGVQVQALKVALAEVIKCLPNPQIAEAKVSRRLQQLMEIHPPETPGRIGIEDIAESFRQPPD